jgi:hypothetical protein
MEQGYVLKTEYEYIFFERLSITNPRSAWVCKNKISKYELGIVEYYKKWSQYIYSPLVPEIYSAGCLDDISEFIKQLK